MLQDLDTELIRGLVKQLRSMVVPCIISCVKSITFVTGSRHKADYLAKYLGHPVDHEELDLEEIQSFDVKKIVQHKLHQAYEIVKKLVLVEDVSLQFNALGRLLGFWLGWNIHCRRLRGNIS